MFICRTTAAAAATAIRRELDGAYSYTQTHFTRAPRLSHPAAPVTLAAAMMEWYA